MAIGIVDLADDAQTRGREFGERRREQIKAYLSAWLDSLATGGVGDPRAYVAAMLRDTDFITDIRKHTPDLLEEAQAIAAGAAQPPELVLASQFMDEEWAYRPGFRAKAAALEKCSSVAIHAREGTTWIGQNMDLGDFTDGHQILMRIGPHGAQPGALVFTIGGMIGLLGVNSHGVGVCVNSLPQLASARVGVPVAFVIRRLLQADNAQEAARILKSIPHATGQHYLIADPAGIRSFEASAAGVFEYHAPDPARVLHTNHPLAQDKGTPTGDATNTVTRLNCLVRRLSGGDPGLEAIQAALSSTDDPDHPVSRVRVGGRVSALTGVINFTTGSMISALRPQAVAIESWVSAGPPSLNAYQHVSLTKS